MLTPALPFPAASKRCTVNYSAEISLSIGTGWFGCAGSRLAGVKGRGGEVWKRRCSSPSSAGFGARAGLWKQQQEVPVVPSSLPERAGAGIQYQLYVVRMDSATHQPVPAHPFLFVMTRLGAAGGRGRYAAQGERSPVAPSSKHRLQSGLVPRQILSKEQ